MPVPFKTGALYSRQLTHTINAQLNELQIAITTRLKAQQTTITIQTQSIQPVIVGLHPLV